MTKRNDAEKRKSCTYLLSLGRENPALLKTQKFPVYFCSAIGNISY
ncbi:MAG: hypothetical protein AB4290_29090 [Spirulina sp.]